MKIPSTNYKISTLKQKQIQRTTTSLVDIKTSTDLKLKNPVFKPYQITKTSQTQLQENQIDFLKAIKTHLQHLNSSSLTVPNTPQTINPSTSINQVNNLQKSLEASSDESTSRNQPLTYCQTKWSRCF